MTARRRKILVAAGIAVALALAALLIAPRFIDANTFRPAIERMARERLGRDVSLGEMSVSFLPPSVTVKDVSVAGAGGGEPWIQAEGVRVRASWSGLLSGRLEVQGIALDAPSVRVLRGPDGKINLVEMVRARGSAAPAGEPGTSRPVSIDQIRVRNGRVSIADAFVKPGEVVRIGLQDLDATVSGLGKGKALDLDVSGEIEGGGRAAYRGSAGPGGALNGQVSTEKLDVALLAPHLVAQLGLPALQGVVTAQLDVKRGENGTSLQGKADVASFRVPGAPPGVTADAKLSLDVSSAPGGNVDIRRFDLESGDTKVSARGGIAASASEQVVTLEIDAPSASLSELSRLASAAGQSLPLQGLQGDDVRLKGKARITRAGEPRTVTSIALDGVEASGVRVALRKEADGTWHLAGDRPASAATPKSAAAKGPQVRVRGLSITDAVVRLEDLTVAPPSVAEATSVRVRIDSWSPGEPGDVEVSGHVAGGTVSLQGRVAAPGDGAAAQPWDARLELEGIDLAKAGALASAAGLQPKSGRADWKATLTGVPGRDLAARGRLELKDARLPLAGGREVEIDMPIEHDVELLDAGRIALNSIVLGLPGGPLRLKGRVQRGEPTRYEIGTDGTAQLTPEGMAWLIALMGRALPVDLELTEPLAIDAKARNAGAGLELSGSARLQRARVRHALLDQPLEIARATVDLAGDRVDLRDAALRLGASALEGSLSLEDFGSPRLVFDLTSPQADLDEIFSIASKAKGSGAAQPGEVPLSRKLRARGRLRVDRATFGGIEMTSFDSTVDLREGRLLFDPATLQLYGGSGGGIAAFDMAAQPLAFDADLNLDGVDAGALLSAAMGYQGLKGTGRMTARLRGEAGSLQETLQRIRGEGTLNLHDGEIGGLNALKALERASVFGEKSLAALGTKLASDGTRFSALDATWNASDGVLRIVQASLTSPDADVATDGRAGLLDKSLDLETVIALAKPISEQMRLEGSRAAEVFWDPKRGQVVLPARITGTLAAPKATIDFGKALSQVLTNENVLQSILGAASGKDRQASDGPASTTKQADSKDVVGGLLGAILGGGGSAQGDAPPPPARESGARTSSSDDFVVQDGIDRPASSSPERAAPSARSSSGPRATIDQARSGGNFLMPDLKIRATLSGTDLSHAIVVIMDGAGHAVVRDDRAFADQVREHYAAAPRDQEAAIPVRLTIPFEKLGGSGPFRVSVEAVDGAGRKGDPVIADVAKSSPF